jgi:hypothetical protein
MSSLCVGPQQTRLLIFINFSLFVKKVNSGMLPFTFRPYHNKESQGHQSLTTNFLFILCCVLYTFYIPMLRRSHNIVRKKVRTVDHAPSEICERKHEEKKKLRKICNMPSSHTCVTKLKASIVEAKLFKMCLFLSKVI